MDNVFVNFLFYLFKFRPNLYIYLYKSSFRSKTTHTQKHTKLKNHITHTNTKRIKKYSDEEKRGGKKATAAEKNTIIIIIITTR